MTCFKHSKMMGKHWKESHESILRKYYELLGRVISSYKIRQNSSNVSHSHVPICSDKILYSPSTVQEFLVQEIERLKILSVYKFRCAYREIKYKKLSHPGHWAPKKSVVFFLPPSTQFWSSSAARGNFTRPCPQRTKPERAEPRKERQHKIKKLRGPIS